jgi:hypothetical protein
MLRLPHCLHNQLTEGHWIGSITHWVLSTLRKIPVLISVRGCQPHDRSAAGRIRSFEKSNDHIENQTHDLPAFIIMPQSTVLPHAPCFWSGVQCESMKGEK